VRKRIFIERSKDELVTSLAAVKFRKRASKLVAETTIPRTNHFKSCFDLGFFFIFIFLSFVVRALKAKKRKKRPRTRLVIAEVEVFSSPIEVELARAKPIAVAMMPVRRVPKKRETVLDLE